MNVTTRARLQRLTLTLLLGGLYLVGCGDREPEGGGTPQPERVLLVTTTTVEASGLLEELVRAYHSAQGRYRLSVTAVGSGAALALGRRGDADLLVTHDPIGEAAFMDEGFGAEQGPLMQNQFIVVGPPADPAGIRGMTDLSEALDRVAESGSRFVSRGDESGTHRRERQLWSRAGVAPWETRPSWYIESGSGMDETLRIADQRAAYTLTGRSTYLNLRDRLGLRSLARGNPAEINAYQWTLPADPPNPDGARHLRNWLVGPGQDVIAGYGMDRFGEALFTPTATALDTMAPDAPDSGGSATGAVRGPTASPGTG